MTKKIVINPITRISGFLEIEAEVENNIIVDARSSGMLFRGFEKMLKGRPPLDAIYFTERICGICSTAHSMASTLALEDAMKVEVDENDKMIRDFLHGCEFLQNHIRHFYQYTLPDYVQGPDIPPVYDLTAKDYRIPKKLNDEIAKHYVESLKYSRLAHEALATIGGKAPHNHGIFVGGVTVNMDSSKFIKVKSIIASIKEFIENVMIEDVAIIARYYKEHFHTGKGHENLMSYGVYNSYQEQELFYVKPGVFIKGKLYQFNKDNITENIYRSWYQSDQMISSPGEGQVQEDVNKKDAYTWVKAPRYKGYPVEVGPLARMWISGQYRNGISTMDRTIARVFEAKRIANILEGLLEKIRLDPANQRSYEIPQTAKGVGLIDTTRGALGHWISIEGQKIHHYDIITPTAWNLSPEDSNGIKGVTEKALMGAYIENINEPVEIGRIVRSFDPCVSCATHVISDKYKSIEMRIT